MEESYRPFLAVIIVFAAAAAALMLAENYDFCGSCGYGQPYVLHGPDAGVPAAERIEISNSGFAPANVTLDGVSLSFASGCYEITFDVTSDQAYSIRNGMDNTLAVRPLAHDIIRDIVDGFNITVIGIRLESFGDDIYYARMFVQQGGKVIDMDIRPSDATAISLRTGTRIYVNETMMRKAGEYVC